MGFGDDPNLERPGPKEPIETPTPEPGKIRFGRWRQAADETGGGQQPGHLHSARKTLAGAISAFREHIEPEQDPTEDGPEERKPPSPESPGKELAIPPRAEVAGYSDAALTQLGADPASYQNFAALNTIGLRGGMQPRRKSEEPLHRPSTWRLARDAFSTADPASRRARPEPETEPPPWQKKKGNPFKAEFHDISRLDDSPLQSYASDGWRVFHFEPYAAAPDIATQERNVGWGGRQDLPKRSDIRGRRKEHNRALREAEDIEAYNRSIEEPVPGVDTSRGDYLRTPDDSKHLGVRDTAALIARFPQHAEPAIQANDELLRRALDERAALLDELEQSGALDPHREGAFSNPAANRHFDAALNGAVLRDASQDPGQAYEQGEGYRLQQGTWIDRNVGLVAGLYEIFSDDERIDYAKLTPAQRDKVEHSTTLLQTLIERSTRWYTEKTLGLDVMPPHLEKAWQGRANLDARLRPNTERGSAIDPLARTRGEQGMERDTAKANARAVEYLALRYSSAVIEALYEASTPTEQQRATNDLLPLEEIMVDYVGLPDEQRGRFLELRAKGALTIGLLRERNAAPASPIRTPVGTVAPSVFEARAAHLAEGALYADVPETEFLNGKTVHHKKFQARRFDDIAQQRREEIHQLGAEAKANEDWVTAATLWNLAENLGLV